MCNEESAVPFLRKAMGPFIAEVRGDVEVVLVNDGSTDSTLRHIMEWADRIRR